MGFVPKPALTSSRKSKTECVAGFVMAINSINQKSIGRSTHQEGTAAAHIRYITRNGALPTIGALNMPANSNEAQEWILEQELADRKNARVCDKLRGALPIELTHEQNYKLIESYVHDLTEKRASYFFAIHDTGKDANNPHVHILIRDRDIETGKRVIGFSDSPRDWRKADKPEESPTHWIRERWEHHVNLALEQAGHDARIDRRTLAAQRDEALQQGDIKRAQELDRKAQIHVGAKAQRLHDKGITPNSKGKYQGIDNGRTRAEHNAEIISFNLEKRLRSKDINIRTWALFEKEQAAKDAALSKQHRQMELKEEEAEKRLRVRHRAHLKTLAAERTAFVDTSIKRKKREQDRAFKTLQAKQKKEREEQERAQAVLFARVRRLFDFTGKYTQKEKQATHALAERHKGQAEASAGRAEAEQKTVRAEALTAYEKKINAALGDRERDLDQLQGRHDKQRERMQLQLQKRALERDHASNAVEQVIKERERMAKQQKTTQEQDNQQSKRGKTMDTRPKVKPTILDLFSSSYGVVNEVEGRFQKLDNASFSGGEGQPTIADRAQEIKAEFAAARSGQGQNQNIEVGQGKKQAARDQGYEID